MRFILGLLTAALLALPASAGTVTVTVVTAAPPCNTGACTKTYTDTDANLGKIITAYAPLCMSQNLQGSPAIPTACTPLATLAWWFDSLIAGTVANVTSSQQQTAIQALPPVTPINPR